MKVSALKYTILSWVSNLTILIILLIPFHAFLTVWGSSIFGHYTALRLWKEVLLVVCVIGVLYLLAFDHKIRSHTLTRRLVWLILTFLTVNIVWGLIARSHHLVSNKALGYGLITDMRFLVFFLVAWAAALRLGRLRAHWKKLILWPAFVVIVFGLLQAFILPHDFLMHFGYGPKTIPVFETINHNRHYYRIAATLRGANPLGAYLLIPISLLSVLLLRPKRNWRQAVLLLGALVVLFFSSSRSAWVGAALSIVIVVLLSVGSPKMRRLSAFIGAALVVIAATLLLVFHHNTTVQNYVYHTQTNSAVSSSSDQKHFSALQTGLKDLAHDPLGRGPGTAGPASVYNTGHPARIAENFYVQIGQETGWLGLALFILINVGVGYLLWLRRSDPLALSLFASFIGLIVVNMFSHAWADDTLAYVWWGLAGIAMAPLITPAKNHAKKS